LLFEASSGYFRKRCNPGTDPGRILFCTPERQSRADEKKPLPHITLNVTIPLHDELDRTTLRSIIKAAELSEEEFLNLLD